VQILKDYLKKRDPKKHLSDIKEHLNKLHTILVQNFPLRDLMIKVGDRRLRDDGLVAAARLLPPPTIQLKGPRIEAPPQPLRRWLSWLGF